MVRHRDREKIQCECCFDDFEATSIVTCPSRHPFCVGCVQRYADSRLGERNTSIECMSSSGCRMPFHRATLDKILPPNTLKLLGRIIQQRELREANIDNLESCPHCDFAMIVDADSESMPLFRCQNVEGGCGKVTCRTCKRDDHSPRTCREEALRCAGAVHTVAEAMSEALMRRCPGCSQPSIKENGCNHLVCPGARLSCALLLPLSQGY
ncbi:hypothetical protein BKA70DRAFT_552432 [Coprinopsis sp. MPI-PUGE-AT-0042]|nr:hypothetical protein BKA70DRAFT_552432 [Coprinopsis sp. MPI-PUGE-AT-0042]